MFWKKNKPAEDIVEGQWKPLESDSYGIERRIEAGNLALYLNDDNSTYRYGYTDEIYAGQVCEDIVDAISRELEPDMLSRLLAHLLVLARNGSPAALLLVDRMTMPARMPIVRDTMASLTENVLGLQSTPQDRKKPMMKRIGREFVRQVIGV